MNRSPLRRRSDRPPGDPDGPGAPPSGRSLLAWIIGAAFVIGAIYLLIVLAGSGTPAEDRPLNAFIADARAGQIASIEARGAELTVRRTGDPAPYHVRISDGTSVEELLRAEGVDLTAIQIDIKSTGGASWLGLLLTFLPFLLIVGVIFLVFRSRGAGGALPGMQITRSGARLAPSRSEVTFADVAGEDEAKEELLEVVEFLRNPARYRAMGAHVPKGVLLLGPPGTGKTYLARAVAGEAAVPFYSISGSQFVELYVGVGAARVRDLFREAKQHAPCIVFIDELDAVGRQRGAGIGGGHDEREQTLNQILVELDGFDPDVNVIVLAATNRPDILDSALVRPGRFDRQVVLDRPDVRGRLAILQVHARNKKLAADVNLETLARNTSGMVGADLANVLNEAALLAARYAHTAITPTDVEEALDRVIAGPQRRSRVMEPREKRLVAVHEAGHAIVGHFLPLADPVTKISIIPRGITGGYTRFTPESDRQLRLREELQQLLAGMLGGRAAEQIFLGDVSTGAEDDIQRATLLARQMVTRWGMSDVLGPLTLGRREEAVFLGRELGEQRNYSDAIAEAIDNEIKRLITTAEAEARRLLNEHRATHQRLVQRLLIDETLSGDELIGALGGPRRPRATAEPITPAPMPEAPDSRPAPAPPRWAVGDAGR